MLYIIFATGPYYLDLHDQRIKRLRMGVRRQQTIIRKSQFVPFESYYWPIGEAISPTSSEFLLEPLLSNSSLVGKSEYAWTYFLLDIPRGAAGGNIHVQLNSNATLDYEIYSIFGGLPSLDTRDYYHINRTSSSNGSVFFKLYLSGKTTINFYILYAKEGTWSFGVRHPIHGGSCTHQTLMSITIKRWPRGGSSHGFCQNVSDASGLTLYRVPIVGGKELDCTGSSSRSIRMAVFYSFTFKMVAPFN